MENEAFTRCDRLAEGFKESGKEVRALRLLFERAGLLAHAEGAVEADTKRVEDSLLERREKSRKKIEALRDEQRRKEMSRCTAVPTINRRSRKMAQRSRKGDAEDISERSRVYAERASEKTRKLRERLEEERVQMMRAKPTINLKSKRMHRGVDEMMEWKDRCELKKEAKRKMRELQELQEAKNNGPRINSKSKMLAEKHRKRSNAPSAKWDSKAPSPPKNVGERLNAEAERRRERLAKKRIEEREKRRAQHHPRISARSASYKRRDRSYQNASERLYNMHQTAEMKKQFRAEHAQFLEIKRADGHDAFKPKINAKSRAIAEGRVRVRNLNGSAINIPRATPSTESVEIRLAKKAEEYKRRRERRVARAQQRAENMSRRVATNSRSAFLAGRRNGSPSLTLHRPIGNVRASTIHEMNNELTFTPTINKRSMKRGGARTNVRRDNKKTSVIKPSSSSSTASKTRSASNGRQRKSRVLAADDGDRQSTQKTDDVAERSRQWAIRRDTRQIQLRSKRQESSTQECTFRPKVNRRRGTGRSRNEKQRELNIAERSMQWLKAKEMKQKKKRSEKEKRLLSGCTFAPETIDRVVKPSGASTIVMPPTVMKKETASVENRVDSRTKERTTWEAYETEDGFVYYYNAMTGETRWAEEDEIAATRASSESPTYEPIRPSSLDNAFRVAS